MTNTPLNPDAFDAAWEALYEAFSGRIGDLNGNDCERMAETAIQAYLAAALPEVTSVEQWDALPIGTMVRVHFNGNSELIIRCPANSGAGIGGMSFIGGRWWTEVFTVWNADTLEIKYIPEVKP
ncbi:hypothetical protein AA310_12380 [Arthrobacter sp. YC-RL1]|uniref:hypothetical protein n=1 Tax=Arthrobacter sp. YC-RL1 TaxID=1652545 RepID=UPI00063D9A0E|nr:hypothetical protein [Arthrobacter sp. YC-RL1]ALQ30093.1 hypothetical protein ATC04_05665 [Arthrobacter sp. YC-RL1]KLI88580.1 hypothetical protein AA310_12380 [Arthrobacter sp. YC-RL1]